MSSLARSGLGSAVINKLSLRTLLITAFVVQISTAVGLIGWLVIRNGQRSVDTLTMQLSTEITARIDQHVQAYLEVPQQFNHINQAAVEAGYLPTEDLEQLYRYFWQQVQINRHLSSIYLGTAEGEFVGVQHRETGEMLLWLKQGGGDRQNLALDPSGNVTGLLSTLEYDPRSRPWYEAVEQARGPAWSPIYRFASTDYAHLGITAAMPLYDAGNQLTGVLAIDITLSQISDFLHTLNISPTGEAFIIERSGAIVASSIEESPFVETANGYDRLNAVDSQSPVIQATAKHLIDRFGSLDQISDRQQLAFFLDGQRQRVEVAPLTDSYGLNWLTVVVIPEADFMARIDASTRATLILCGGLLLISVGIGVAVARWLASPIQQLSQTAQRLAEGDWEQPLPQSNYGSVRETADLAAAFNQMAIQLRQSFQDLEAKNRDLQELDRLKDEFLANTSHELRTPLNGIIGLSESLIDGVTGPLPPATIANLEMIASSGRRLSTLVNDLLDFSQVQDQRFQLQGQSLSLRTVVEPVVRLCEAMIGDRNLQLRVAIAPDLPPIFADEYRLQQILYNLIGNALKFTEQGWVEVSARVEASPESSQPWMTVSVTDTGIGIPSDRQTQIFQPFTQADGSTSRHYGGTGLGLAVTQALVELHGGRITVISEVGKGSQFTFTMPLASEISNAALADRHTSNPTQPLFESKPLRSSLPGLSTMAGDLATCPLPHPSHSKILLVDDEPVNLQVLANYLSLEAYDVMQSSSGVEALTWIEQGLKPDLIVLDVMMPQMSGYEFCQRLRDRYSAGELPVLMLTARHQVDDLVEGLTAGANDYLRKPVAKREFLARIKTHLELTKTNSAYARFVPHEFLQLLGHETIVNVGLGDQVQAAMTIMFADIRSFTQLSEAMTPEESFNFLNTYLSRVGPVVRQHHGFIDKYIGDAVMALFPNQADDAIQAAIAMQHQVQAYNQERAQQGIAPIAIGIGMHTGDLILGTIGEQERMESTVIADAVNLASRLERLTKLYGASILVSAATLKGIAETTAYQYRFLDRVQVRGKQEHVSVWEFFGGDLPKIADLKAKTQTQFEQAVCLYHDQSFEAAQAEFEAIAAINAMDIAAHLYIKRCQRYQRHGVPELWDQFSP